MENSRRGMCLHKAVSNKDIEAMRIILNENSQEIDSLDEFGRSPLHCCVEFHFEEGVTLLLERGARTNVQNIKGETPLHYAVAIKSQIHIEKLLKRGVDIECNDVNGDTPIHLAVKRDFATGVEILLLKGCNINIENSVKDTPLQLAMYHENEKLIRTLLEKGPDLEHKSMFGDTALHYAASLGCAMGVELLLEKNVNVNAVGYFDNTPLLLAVKSNHDDIIVKLLAKGADIKHKDKSGQTALHLAVKCLKNVSTIVILLESGAEVNVKDVHGQTPMHVAVNNAISSDCQIIEQLLYYGGSLVIADEKGVTPFVSVLSSYKPSLEKLLIQHVIKSQYIGININSGVGNAFHYSNLEYFQISCLEEIEKMKSHKFGQYSFYNNFFKPHDPSFVLNNQMKEAIESLILDDEFPIYSSYLRITFKQNCERLLLLDNAQNKLIFMPFPVEIVRHILSFLDDEDLTKIVETDGN